MFVGDHFYGKVDHVPGMFFVKTRFLHYLWIPVVPRESWLMRDDGSSVGVRIPLRWKSVWLAWVRTFFVAMVVTFTVAGVAFARMEPEAGKMHPGIIAFIPWGIALVLGAGVLYGVTHIAGTSAGVVYGTTLLVASAVPVSIARLCHRMLHQPVYFGESRGFWITLCCASWVLGAFLSIFSLL